MARRSCRSRGSCARACSRRTPTISRASFPTFELGRKAGLGLPIADADLTATNALAPAWTLTATAPAASAVARLLLVAVPHRRQAATSNRWRGCCALPRRRDWDSASSTIGTSGLRRCPRSVAPATTVKVEGALMPLTGTGSPVLWSDPVALDVRNRTGEHRQSTGLESGGRAIGRSAARSAALRPLACGARARDAGRRELVRRAESRSALAHRSGARHAASFRNTRKR